MIDYAVSSVKNRFSTYATTIIFLALLFLRFPLIFASIYGFIDIKKEIIYNFMYDSTYLLFAILILIKRKSLCNYNINLDTTVILFIIVPIIKPITNILPIPFQIPTYFSLFQIVIAIVLTFILIISRTQINIMNSRKLLIWIIISIVSAMIVGGVTGYIIGLGNTNRYMHASISIEIFLFITQLSNAAIIEEPLFRGFLWGALRNRNLKECQIWIIQMVLFWSAHLYYFTAHKFSFWVIIPVAGMLLGFLVWKSKTLTTSIIAHGIINSFGNIVAGFKL